MFSFQGKRISTKLNDFITWYIRTFYHYLLWNKLFCWLNPLVIEIRDEEGATLSTMYLKTEVEDYIKDYIFVQVTSTSNEVKDGGDGWHWNEPEGLDISPITKTATQLVLEVNSASINSYNLTITAEPEMGGDNATDSCTIRAADISLNSPDLIGYADGMNIHYSLNPPISVPIGIIRIKDSSDNNLYVGIIQSSSDPINGDLPWNGKGNRSPYNGLYLPGGDYKITYTTLGFQIEKEFRIVEVGSVSDIDYYTGRQYVPVGNSDCDVYLYNEGHFYYADTNLILWAESDPSGISFPDGSPLWSCTMSPTEPPISSENGNTCILVNNYLGSQTENFTVTAKASSNDPVGASVDLTSFSAIVFPDNDFIDYEMGTDIIYIIFPFTGWSYHSAEFCITNRSEEYVYKCPVTGFSGEIEWDGKGNQGTYNNQYLHIGEYWIGIEIVPFDGSDKYCFNTSSSNLRVVNVDITSPEGSLDATVANPNPISSWSSTLNRFDFQGIKSGATGAYVLTFSGSIAPTPYLSYKWTLDTAAGTITGDTTNAPTHRAPAAAGEGFLTLKAMVGTEDTGVNKTRKLKIYDDHLARDMENFETDGLCSPNWNVTTFNVEYPGPNMGHWNCHGSTRHAFDGTYNGNNTGQPWLSWSVKTVVVTTHGSSGNGSHPSLGTLDRGDVVAYFSPNGKPYNPPNISDLSSWTMQHSQACTGNSDETYGANNKPKTYPGAPGQGQSWRWATSPAGDWATHIWQPSLQGAYVPFIIVVFDKP